METTYEKDLQGQGTEDGIQQGIEEVEAEEEVVEMKSKQYSDTCKVASIDEAERTVTAVISSDAIDRDREILLPKGIRLERFERNPVVLWSHDASSPPIAKALWVKKGAKRITAKLKFAVTERAEEVWQLFKDGFLHAFSVGFMPLKGHTPTPDEIKKTPEWAEARYIIDEWELLEFSPVTVPANPDALMLACKNGKIHISKALQADLDIDTSIQVEPVGIPVKRLSAVFNTIPFVEVQTAGSVPGRKPTKRSGELSGGGVEILGVKTGDISVRVVESLVDGQK